MTFEFRGSKVGKLGRADWLSVKSELWEQPITEGRSHNRKKKQEKSIGFLSAGIFSTFMGT